MSLGCGWSTRRMDKARNRIRFGTWNITSLTGKELEIIQEIEKYKVQVLGLAEIKKKGSGLMNMDKGYVLRYSGSPRGNRTTEGVGIIMSSEMDRRVTSWEPVNSRIMSVSLNLQESVGIIQIYAPTESATVDEKDTFYEDLQRETEKMQSKNQHIIIMGDWNAHIGNQEEEGHGTMGKFGLQGEVNDNGQRMLDYCITNDMLIGNTWFKHKTIHKITYEAENLGHKSMIDYIVYARSVRYAVNDVKVIRGAELSTGHRLVVADTNIRRPNKDRARNYKRIKLEVLEDPNRTREYEDTLVQRLEENENQQWDLNERWKKFKEVILQTAEEICGTAVVRQNNEQKRTKWWNEEVKRKVKEKKEAWIKYIRTKSNNDRGVYIQKRNEAKAAVKQAKLESWEEFGRKIEENYLENQKQFWNVVKRLKGNRTQKIRSVRNFRGELQTETKGILEAWAQYYTTKFKEEERLETELRHQEESRDQEEENNEITEEETKDALRKTKNGKAAGEDGISAEMLKKGGPVIIRWLTRIFQQAWTMEKVPKDWERNIIVPLYKKGDSTDCNNYRAICLSAVAFKIYSRILENRLRSEIEHRIQDEQAAYRPGRQTQDHIYTIRALTEKRLDKNKELYIACLDLKAAFDMVPRRFIWEALERLDVSVKLRRVIKGINTETIGLVRLNGQKSTEFKMERGIKQGDSLSPLLFIIYMDSINELCKNETRNTGLGYLNLNPVMTQDLLYADDIVVIATSEEQLQRKITVWKNKLKDRGMQVNVDKSKVMKLARGNQGREGQIQIDETQLQNVGELEYLGVILSSDGRVDKEVRNRISKANKVYYQINNTLVGKKELSKKAKIQLYKTIYVPTILYGAETWAILDKHRSAITASEMRYLRRILGKRRRDRVRNRSIRGELEVEPLVERVELKQLQWYGHMVRMSGTRWTKKVFGMRCEGRRPRGRPRTVWEDNVREAARRRGKTIEQIKTLATDRNAYNRWLKTPTP